MTNLTSSLPSPLAHHHDPLTSLSSFPSSEFPTSSSAPLWTLFSTIYHALPNNINKIHNSHNLNTTAAGVTTTAPTTPNAPIFEFTPGKTPLSTLNKSVLITMFYYAMIVSGREWMRHRKPFSLRIPFLVHNFVLSALSGVLLALFLEQVVPKVMEGGVLFAICDARGGWTGELVLLYYLNYLTKYLEFLDTAFLIAKKKPLTFLHCYHHGATALLCYVQLAGKTAVSWVPITLNLTVHVIMYAYYFLSARGVRVWWKEWVTRLQIAQFVIDLGFVYFSTWTYFVSNHWPWLPHKGNCAGEPYAAVAGCAILTSYLVLFVAFYLSTYKSGGRGRGVRANQEEKKVVKEVKWEESVKSGDDVLEQVAGAKGMVASGVSLDGGMGGGGENATVKVKVKV